MRFGLTRPVLQAQAGDSPELPLVVRHEGQVSRHGLRGDERIERPDRSSGSFKPCANVGIDDRVIGCEVSDGKRAKKILDEPKGLDRGSALCGARSELRLSDHAHQDLFPAFRQQLIEYIAILLERIDAGVGIE